MRPRNACFEGVLTIIHQSEFLSSDTHTKCTPPSLKRSHDLSLQRFIFKKYALRSWAKQEDDGGGSAQPIMTTPFDVQASAAQLLAAEAEKEQHGGASTSSASQAPGQEADKGENSAAGGEGADTEAAAGTAAGATRIQAQEGGDYEGVVLGPRVLAVAKGLEKVECAAGALCALQAALFRP